MSFAGASIIVTGAGRGIGAALARAFAARGGRVTVADLDGDAARAIATEVGGLSYRADVAHEADVIALVEMAEQAHGPVDLFCSNAGIALGEPGHAASASNADWQRNWDVHVMAHVYAARAVLPGMIARGGGRLVQVASAAGLLNQIGDSAYSATKHAAVSFAQSLAITHADDGIDVSVVCPQYVATPLIGHDDAGRADQVTLLDPDDVAQVVLDGVADKCFLILPHPEVQRHATARAEDPDRWVAGMARLRRKVIDEHGGIEISELYKFI